MGHNPAIDERGRLALARAAIRRGNIAEVRQLINPV